MDEATFKQPTREAALRLIRLVEALPRTRTADVLGKRLLGSGTSIGANYALHVAPSPPPIWPQSLRIVEEETDESLYWIELLTAAELVNAKRTEELTKELHEIAAMTVASIKTLRRRSIQNPKPKIQNA